MPADHGRPTGRKPRRTRTRSYRPPHVSEQRTWRRLRKADRERILNMPLGGVRPGQQRLDVEG